MANKITLSKKIAKLIRDEFIDSGAVQRGDALPTMRALQQRYDTSVTTISHALGQLEAQGLVEKLHGRGCFVLRDSFDALRRQQKRMIAFVTPPLAHSPLMVLLYEGVERAARRHGAQVAFAAAETYHEERPLVQELLDSGCEGLVLMPHVRALAELESDYLLTDFKDVPMVLVDLGVPEQGRLQIIFDNYRAGYQMAQLLIQEGHRHIAFTHFLRRGRQTLYRSVHDRHRGFIAALRQAGIGPRPQDNIDADWRGTWLDANGSPAHCVVEMLEAWRATADPASAIVAAHDKLAVAIIQAARRLGIAVPEELRVVGFDNLEVGQLMRPPFPTTAPDFALAGEKAVDLLIEQIEGEISGPMTYVLPAPVLPRGMECAAASESAQEVPPLRLGMR